MAHTSSSKMTQAELEALIPDPMDFDLSIKRKLFVGERVLEDKHIYISNADLDRTFLPSEDSNKPSRGIIYDRYLHTMEHLQSGGIDPNNQKYRPPVSRKRKQRLENNVDPALYNVGVKTLAELEDEAIRACLVVNEEDQLYLLTVAKNVFCHRMQWLDTTLAAYVIKQALGIDVDHPWWQFCLIIVNRNRDTWQNRALQVVHTKAKRFLFHTARGKAYLVERNGKPWFEWDEEDNNLKNLFLCNPDDLVAEGLWSLVVAKEIYYEVVVGLDEKELEIQGKPTGYGELLMWKALSLIQLEITYIIANWVNFSKMTYNKQGKHSRVGIILSYLTNIDSLTNLTAEVYTTPAPKDPVTGATLPMPPNAIKKKVSFTFPLKEGVNMWQTRRNGKAEAVGAVSNQIRIPQALANLLTS